MVLSERDRRNNILDRQWQIGEIACRPSFHKLIVVSEREIERRERDVLDAFVPRVDELI